MLQFKYHEMQGRWKAKKDQYERQGLQEAKKRQYETEGLREAREDQYERQGLREAKRDQYENQRLREAKRDHYEKQGLLEGKKRQYEDTPAAVDVSGTTHAASPGHVVGTQSLKDRLDSKYTAETQFPVECFMCIEAGKESACFKSLWSLGFHLRNSHLVKAADMRGSYVYDAWWKRSSESRARKKQACEETTLVHAAGTQSLKDRLDSKYTAETQFPVECIMCIEAGKKSAWFTSLWSLGSHVKNMHLVKAADMRGSYVYSAFRERIAECHARKKQAAEETTPVHAAGTQSLKGRLDSKCVAETQFPAQCIMCIEGGKESGWIKSTWSLGNHLRMMHYLKAADMRGSYVHTAMKQRTLENVRIHLARKKMKASRARRCKINPDEH